VSIRFYAVREKFSALGDCQMNFEIIRLVLVSREQTSLFERRHDDGTELTREQWLRQIFSRELVFRHRGKEFHYLHQPDEGSLIIGQIGCQASTAENEPPENGFRATIHESWQAAAIIIDPRHHADGQKLAFEARAQVGTALAIVKSL
jgi:hypothetical protein